MVGLGKWLGKKQNEQKSGYLTALGPCNLYNVDGSARWLRSIFIETIIMDGSRPFRENLFINPRWAYILPHP